MKNKNDSSQSICPVCRAMAIDLVLEIFQIPIHVNLFWLTKESAIRAPKADIKLGFCRNCGHVFNLAFKQELMKYTRDYENSLHFSPTFQKYAKSLAGCLVEKYDLHDKDIIEIGCGKGDFIRLLCELGRNRGTGFDPTSKPEQNSNKETKAKITFIQDFYSKRYANYKADFICCRHVLEHIQYPRVFLRDVRKSIGTRLNTFVFLEVPNGLFTLRDLGIWDLIYEHCSYFSPSSLSFLFNACSFKVCDLEETYEGQYLSLSASPAENLSAAYKDNGDSLCELISTVEAFTDKYQQKVNAWRNKLESIQQSNKKAVVWGGGSKGVTLLNILEAQDQIKYVVDINPRKQGKYIAGTGQLIIAPDFLRRYKPDIIIVMNSIYQGEIQQITKSLGLESLIFLNA